MTVTYHVAAIEPPSAMVPSRTFTLAEEAIPEDLRPLNFPDPCLGQALAERIGSAFGGTVVRIMVRESTSLETLTKQGYARWEYNTVWTIVYEDPELVVLYDNGPTEGAVA